MVVLTLEKVSRSLRGELTRWLVELDTGVFVGRVSARVREHLWQRVVEKAGDGRVAMAWHTNNEQGFKIRLFGHEDREIVVVDGVELVAVKNAKWKRVWRQHQRWLKRRKAESSEFLDKKTPDTSGGSSGD